MKPPDNGSPCAVSPDHGRFRDSELPRHLLEVTVARCIAEGLVSGERPADGGWRMADDASLIEADANKQNSTPNGEWDASKIDGQLRQGGVVSRMA